ERVGDRLGDVVGELGRGGAAGVAARGPVRLVVAEIVEHGLDDELVGLGGVGAHRDGVVIVVVEPHGGNAAADPDRAGLGLGGAPVDAAHQRPVNLLV